MYENKYKNDIYLRGVPDEFIEQGTILELQKICKIDVESLQRYFETFN